MKMHPIVRLTGVLTKCPFASPLKGCVFDPIRQSSLSDRMRWLHNLTEEAQEKFALIHDRCATMRESNE
jgi:hypothetical protein